MRRRSIALTAAAAAAALVAVVGTTASAYAGPTATASSQQKSYHVTDQDLAQLFITGTGPLADSHPEVVQELGFNRLKNRPSAADSAIFVKAFLAKTPGFHQAVAVPALTGDPYQVKVALINLTHEVVAYVQGLQANASAAHKATDPRVSATGVPNGVVAANINVLANVYLYANVVAGTEVAVGAAFVAVIGAFWLYQFNLNSSSSIDVDHLLAVIATGLKTA